MLSSRALFPAKIPLPSSRVRMGRGMASLAFIHNSWRLLARLRKTRVRCYKFLPCECAPSMKRKMRKFGPASRSSSDAPETHCTLFDQLVGSLQRGSPPPPASSLLSSHYVTRIVVRVRDSLTCCRLSAPLETMMSSTSLNSLRKLAEHKQLHASDKRSPAKADHA